MQREINEIKELLSKANIKNAVNRLESIKDGLERENQNHVFDIIITYNRIKRDDMLGLETPDNLRIRQNKLNSEILRFLSQFETKESSGYIQFSASKKNELKNSIAKGNTKEALNKLINSENSLHPRIQDRVIELAADLSNLDRQMNLGIISHEFYTNSANKVNFDLIRIIDVLDDRKYIEKLDELELTKDVSSETDGEFQIPDVPENLLTAIINGECVLYLGAGLSARAGLPTWNSFVWRLVDWAYQQQIIDRSYSTSLSDALNDNESDLVADSVIAAVSENDRNEDLITYLKEVFLNEHVELPEAHQILSRINFSAAISTNFDMLMEETFKEKNGEVFCPQDTEVLFSHFSKKHFFLLKLYGNLNRPDTVLVSPNQYEEAMADNMPFSEFIEALFVSRTILFLGSSLDGIEAYFGGLKFKRTTQMKEHYALVDVSGNAWRAKADMLERRFGIKILPFQASPQYPEVLQFIKKFNSLLESRIKALEKDDSISEPAQSLNRAHAHITSVVLENIGPFDKLELNLDANWNIFVGDNGVGKSTILKAIALGITGEDASPYVDRLIKTGKTNGLVKLIMSSGKEYVTTLLKKGSGGTKIKSLPGLFLQSENFLSIGFPAVRTVNWTHSKLNYQEGVNRPLSNDLLPILSKDPDPRMNQLKEWIFSLDHRLRKEQINIEDDNSTYGNLLKDFFKVVDEITVGMRLEYQGIDLNANQVLMTTDDGVVPLDSVSQGTASLLGWIGVFLQRLYEIYDFKDNPRNNYALVLMDEIDAHMHPEWQQKIQPILSKLFPNVQFVATTHSPLVVGGMPVKQVFRFSRDEDRKIFQLKLEPDATMGRANQLLTSELFGLDTTLDKKPKTVENIDRYEYLYSIERTEEQEKEFQEIRRELDHRIPVPANSKTEERALKLIEVLLEEQIGSGFPKVEEKVLERAKSLFNSIAKNNT